MTSGRVVAIVQARVGSTRLPGKVLMPLGGRPMVVQVLDRARLIAGVHEVVAAVPDLVEDDALAEAAAAAGAKVLRGPADDVLERYSRAATASSADVVVRLTADCPLLSPQVSGLVLDQFRDCDYASNTLRRSYPRGLDTEVFGAQALDVAAREAVDPAEREHVTPFLYRRPERFRLREVVDATDRSAMRWTVDTPDDMALARAVYDALGSRFEMDDVLALLADRPELAELNRDSVQKPIG